MIVGAMVAEAIAIEREHNPDREDGYLRLRAAVSDASEWPIVSDEDWCGEYQTKPGSEGAQ